MSQNLSIAEKLKFIKVPILYVYSKKNCFVHVKHADHIAESMNQSLIIREGVDASYKGLIKGFFSTPK